MIKRLLTILIIFFMLNSCMNLIPIQEKQLKKPYPTSHIFNFPIKRLRESVCSYFSPENQYHSSFYPNQLFYENVDYLGNGNITKSRVVFNEETSEDNRILSKDFFSIPGTKYDIYLHTYGQPWYSPIYYARGKPLEFRVKFRLRLTFIDSTRTQLKIEIESPCVIKGISGLGPHGFIGKDIEVKSTTVEEYSLLLYIANMLGDTTLPPLDLEKNIIE